jgi:hypothetical protein
MNIPPPGSIVFGQQLLANIGEVPERPKFATSLAESIVKSLVAIRMGQEPTAALVANHLMPAPALLRAA